MTLRLFSKITCVTTLFLIFAGGMVTSTGSGLSVPDWPLSYGTLFPPMIGGIFYEHGHRMIASLVGLLTLIMTIWICTKETRKWVKVLSIIAICAVIAQGLLGGLTVLLLLPKAISISHAVLAQTFFIITIVIAYALSLERKRREDNVVPCYRTFIRIAIGFIVLVYMQLILGALMRHTHSGLAIYDFPTMAGYWIPPMNEEMLIKMNSWLFDHDLDPVTLSQIHIHLTHRIMAAIIVIAVCILNIAGLKWYKDYKSITNTILALDTLIILQICLGILTVLTEKTPLIASLHVAVGAATLGYSTILALRVSPLKISLFLKQILPGKL